MAKNIIVEEELFIDVDAPEEKIDDIVYLISCFIDNDVSEYMSNIMDDYDEDNSPYVIKLVIKSGDNNKLTLTKDELDYIEYRDCISDALDHVYCFDSIESESVQKDLGSYLGYIFENPFWEKKVYYHYVLTNFETEYDALKGEIVVVAKCYCTFMTGYYDSDDECHEISYEQYIEDLEELYTDEPTIRALDKATGIEEYGYEEELKLTKEEKEILVTIGYYDDYDYPDTIDGYAGKMHHVGYGAYCDDDGDNWDFL